MRVDKLLNGAWQVSAIIDGYLVVRTYYGFTKREAIQQFKIDKPGTVAVYKN